MKKLKILELLMTVVPIVLIVLVQFHFIHFDPDHLIEILGGIPVAFKLVSEIRSDKLEKFTTANVLAVGYFKNFATPMLDAMLTQQLISPERRLCVFLPDKISDFEPSKMNKLKAFLHRPPLSCSTQTVVISQAGDKRNVLEVHNSQTGKSCYIDFPATLLSLNALLDYEMEKKIHEDNDAKKDQRGKYYISLFQKETEKLLAKNGQEELVHFIKDLNELL